MHAVIYVCTLTYIFAAIKGKKPDDTSQAFTHPIRQVLGVGSMVQFGDPVQYGIIKVMSKDPYTNEEFAEMEMVIRSIW